MFPYFIYIFITCNFFYLNLARRKDTIWTSCHFPNYRNSSHIETEGIALRWLKLKRWCVFCSVTSRLKPKRASSIILTSENKNWRQTIGHISNASVLDSLRYVVVLIGCSLGSVESWSLDLHILHRFVILVALCTLETSFLSGSRNIMLLSLVF